MIKPIMPVISLLHATRGMPQRALETRNKWLDAADDPSRIEHIFGVQSDDDASIVAFSESGCKYVITDPPPSWASSSVDNWNAAAEESTGHLLVVIADDLFPFDGYDSDLMIESISKNREELEYVIHVQDTFRPNFSLMCHPILSRAAYKRLGNRIFHPEFYGVHCDTDLRRELAQLGIRVFGISGKMFDHQHPYSGSREWDSVATLQNSTTADAYGRAVSICHGLTDQDKPPMVEDIHAVWVGSEMGTMERLTLELLSPHHNVTVFTDREHKHLPDNVSTEPLPDGFPEPVPYQGIPLPGIRNGGIGSVAHWSDLLAYYTLHHRGGCWIQMDVAAVEPIRAFPYTFAPFGGGIQPSVMTAVRGSKWALRVFEDIYNDTMDGWAGQDWLESIRRQNAVLNRMQIMRRRFSGFGDCGGMRQSAFTHPARKPFKMIHWSNATHGHCKENPVPGSEYERLCKLTGLL